MAATITSLTQHETDLMTVYRDKSMAIGLQAGPADRPKSAEFLAYAYKRASLVLKGILFARSPQEARGLYSRLLAKPDLLAQFQFGPDGMASADQDAIIAEIMKMEAKPVSITAALDGNHDTAWVQYAKYWIDNFSDRISFPEETKEAVDMLELMTKSMNWCYCFKHLAIVCDRPKAVLENGVIHNESGPAVEFTDGFKIYALHGHIVPDFVVTDPSRITTDVITEYQSKNQEVARIMVDIYGPEKYFMELGGEVIDTDQLNFEGSSMRMLIQDKLGLKWLIGSDGGTGRVYHMPAGADATTCSQAHSQMCGFDETQNCVCEC
jgi:hypothetical protein